MLVRQRNQESVYNSVHYRHSWALLHGFRSNFLLVAYVQSSKAISKLVYNKYVYQHTEQQMPEIFEIDEFSQHTDCSVVFFPGSLLVRIVVDLIQALPKEVLNLTFALANINSFLNPFNYFINIAEFKIVLKRVCSITQWSDQSPASTM